MLSSVLTLTLTCWCFGVAGSCERARFFFPSALIQEMYANIFTKSQYIVPVAVLLCCVALGYLVRDFFPLGV